MFCKWSAHLSLASYLSLASCCLVASIDPSKAATFSHANGNSYEIVDIDALKWEGFGLFHWIFGGNSKYLGKQIGVAGVDSHCKGPLGAGSVMNMESRYIGQLNEILLYYAYSSSIKRDMIDNEVKKCEEQSIKEDHVNSRPFFSIVGEVILNSDSRSPKYSDHGLAPKYIILVDDIRFSKKFESKWERFINPQLNAWTDPSNWIGLFLP